MDLYLDALITLGSLAALWVFFCWLHRDYRNDAFRQELFALRDRLFDLALRGRIGFEHPAYQTLRTSLNNLLYNAEDVSFIGTLMLAAARGKDEVWIARDKRIWREWTEALSGLDSDVANELAQIKQLSEFRMIEHLLLTSPLLQMTLAPVLLAAISSALVSGLVRLFMRLGIRADVLTSPFAEGRPAGC